MSFEPVRLLRNPLQTETLKLSPTLRGIAQAGCKPEEYFEQWRSSAPCAKGANKERWRLL